MSTEVDDMKEEAEHIRRKWLDINKLRKALQKRAIDKMARGENVNDMVEIVRTTKLSISDEDY